MDIFFYIFATLGLLFGLRVVTAKSPIAAAFSLVMTFFCVAAIYALMEAHFIAAIQILVYAGAVMVLFTFVIMLLDADTSPIDYGKGFVYQVVATLMAALVYVGVNWSIRHGQISAIRGNFTKEIIDELGGNSRVLSEVLFSDYILPFELTSILLLVGIVGSVALAKRAKRGSAR